MNRAISPRLRNWLAAATLLAGLLAAGVSFASGQVVFVRGEVQRIDASGQSQAFQAGASLEAGQSVRTGDDGHVHLRFDDGSFVSVRPRSRFTLDAFNLDASRSGGVQVRFRLDYGVVRTITGTAIEGKKDRFRFNTPLAAIGVRGTDYVVYATADFTRASVNAGAIVLAPLGGGCAAEALGPCDNSAARVLTAAMRDAYLELRAGALAPVVVQGENGGKQAPNAVSPPAPEEPRVLTPGAVSRSSATEDTLSTVTAERVRDTAATVVQNPSQPVFTPPPPQIVWGRWSTVAAPAGAAPLVASLLGPNYTITTGNSTFGLLRSADTPTLPGAGVAGFRLANAEAYLRQGDALSPAAIRDATLTIDFGARRFDTQLTFVHGDTSQPLNASGQVQWQGYLYSDPARSTMNVVGVLAGASANEAGYLFDRTLQGGAVAVGATRWQR